MVGRTFSHYRIIEKLGQGGMGIVFKAEDTRLGRAVALKFLPDDLSRDPSAIERFLREARAASSLSHPHICAVHDVGEHDGVHFIVMELLDGVALSEQISGTPVPVDRIVALGIQIADALSAAHARNILHRDIKPANIFITSRGEAKVLDFGLAKSVAASPHAGTDATTLAPLTDHGTMVGTVAYMSPEQVRGETLDGRSDLFSLGAVLYEMATARRAFAGATAGAIHDEVLNRHSPPASRLNPELPQPLQDVIDKALEKDRSLRYQSAAEIGADLQRIKRDMDSARAVTLAAPREVPATPLPSWRRRLGILAAVAVVALALAGSWFGVLRPKPEALDSVAVLPFVNADGDPDSEYLSDGITESLINNLSQVRTLRVSAWSTVFRYKGKAADPQAIGHDLGVSAVLSGRLLRRDGHVIVRTELIDVSNGAQLWGREFNHTAADVIALQDDLAAEISEKLRLRLTKEEQQQLNKRYTQDAAAYELYLKGRYYWNKRNLQDVQRAIGYFERAIALDPQYALAYAGLADAYNQASFFNASPPGDVMPRARAAASRALEIDEHLADAHISLAYVSFTYDWDWAAATKHTERARALNPVTVDNHSFYPFYLTVARRPDEAVRAAERALAKDPLSASLSHNRAVQLVLSRQYDAAIAECRRTIELDPAFAIAYEVLGATYEAKGMPAEALPQVETAVRLNPHSPMSLAMLAYVDANLKRDREARRILEQLTTASRERYVPALAFAVIHTGLNEKDQAFGWLEKAYVERSNRLAYLAFEPSWDRLRSDPRFDDLLRRIGLPR
jgi:TolB-like protein/Tfp pilus assembly protein PilF